MNLGKESEKIEFKESVSEIDAAIRSISSMLNRNNEGIVYFGVKDNGDVIGIDIANDTTLKIKEKIKTKIRPLIIPKIEELITHDNLKYIKIEAYGTNIPYSYDGRYFIRTGASDDQIDVHMLTNIIESKTNDRIREKISPLQNLSFKYVLNLLNEHKIHIESKETFYRSYNLITSKSKFNMTAFLLSDQNSIPIRVIQFAGTDRTEMINKNEFVNQSLLKTFFDVFEYIKIFNTHRIDDMRKERIETPLFDESSVREAIINALIHNDWKNETPPTIFMFNDRLEIFSYGELPFGLTKEMVYNGFSRPINSGLFTIFMICQVAEQSGHGIPTIIKKYGRDAYDFSGGAIKVTIKFAFELVENDKNDKNNINTKTNDLVKEPQTNPKQTPNKPQTNPKENVDNYCLSDKEKEILELIKHNSNITITKIATELNSSVDSIQHYINKLKKNKILIHRGATKNGFWQILENNI